MDFDIKIEQVVDKFAISVINSEGSEELIADIYTSEDVLLISYFIDQAKKGVFNSEDFATFILENKHRFPFLEVPEIKELE
jgi:hypothetical protein